MSNLPLSAPAPGVPATPKGIELKPSASIPPFPSESSSGVTMQSTLKPVMQIRTVQDEYQAKVLHRVIYLADIPSILLRDSRKPLSLATEALFSFQCQSLDA
jgi:hypothetical protein